MKHQSRIILAGMLGNLVEAYDMALCGLLSMYLAKYLTQGSSQGLFILFMTFFTGYLARPIGAIALGLFSDVYGRKITLAASILTMGIATACIGFIPSHQILGSTSVSLLLVLRIIQSFSCGAEYLNSSAYMVENAAKNHKGYSGSWASFGSTAGILCASVAALIISKLIDKSSSIESIIWRIPFMISLFGTTIGLYIRMFIPESLEYIVYYADRPKPKMSSLLTEAVNYLYANKIRSFYVFCLSSLGVTTTFLFYIYAPTQAHIYGTFSDKQIMISNIIALITLLIVFPLAGRLADMVHPKKLIIISATGLLILSQPFFYILSYGKYEHFILTQALISIPSGIYYATVPLMLTNMFPINLRCTVLSFIYSIAASLSAGLTPLTALILLEKTHICTSPALLIFLLVGATILSMLLKIVLKPSASANLSISGSI